MDFMWRICFDLYARLRELLEAKNGSRQWGNLENKRMKKKMKESKTISLTALHLQSYTCQWVIKNCGASWTLTNALP